MKSHEQYLKEIYEKARIEKMHRKFVTRRVLTLCFSCCLALSLLISVLFVQSGLNKPDESDKTGSATGSSPKTDAPYYTSDPLHYNSVNELKKAISQENIEQLYAHASTAELPPEKANELKENVRKIQAQGVIVPCLNGKATELRNKDGLPNISLFISEAYGLPWVYYYPFVSTGENFYIKITRLPNHVTPQQTLLTASEAIKELSPNSPNIGNLGEQHKEIYNQRLRLLNREVTALICEYKADNRSSIMFIYDELLVEVRCNPKVWGDSWFAALSLDYLNE